MTEEKLPRELPEIGDKYWDAFNQMGLQRNADQLLYDALWAENERLRIVNGDITIQNDALTFKVNALGAELAKVKLEMVGFITRYCDSRMTQHTGYGGQEELARLKTVITSRYGV